jgi:hypothetical protein
MLSFHHAAFLYHSRVTLQGRLGSLGTIPDKYDIAVSTACGSLNNMVVDTVTQGQACIEFSRKQNIGHASFMVLEKLPTDKLGERVVTPEGVPRLSTLSSRRNPASQLLSTKALGTPLLPRTWTKQTGLHSGDQGAGVLSRLQGS